ncbi:MAG TPA: type IV pilus biogenesis/stability protein PilW [Telluria sp.]|nr:type IV pilus biogenesis/stability protein PilW [Telluria sp.]
MAARPLARQAWVLVLAALLAACAGGPAPQELRTASDATSNEKLAGIRLQLASGYYQDGKYEVALDEVKQAINAYPGYAEAYGMRGLIYSSMGQTALAESNYRRALELAPSNPDLANNYGSFLCQNGKPAEALRQFDSALANRTYRSPLNAMVNAGTCAVQIKNYELAERYLLDALRIAPDQPSVNAALAKVYFERRDMTRARFFINRLTSTQRLDSLSAETLWLAVRIERHFGDKAMETSLATQLRKQHPGSPEYAAYQRGAFDQ